MSETPPPEAQSFTARISMWSSRHRRLVVLAWFVLIILAIGTCSVIEADTDVELIPPGEAGEALKLFDDRFGEVERGETEFIVFSHPSLTVDDEAYAETVEGLRDVLVGLVAEETITEGTTTVVSDTRVVAAVTTHYDIGAPREGSPFVATRDGSGDVTFMLVEMEGDTEEAADNIGLVLDAVADYEPAAAFQDGAGEEAILIGGTASLFKQIGEMIEEDFAQATILNLPITFVILLLAFGAVLAAFVPLVLAFTAIFVAMAILTAISQVFALGESYQQIVLLMGLATGIDYALFVITRYRNERTAGRSKDDALRVASGTSGKAVVFAGATTVFAVGSMFLVGDKIFSSLGLAAIVVVLVAVLSAVTLLPALIAFLGDNVDRFSIPFLGRGGGEGGVWSFIIDRVLQRPAIFAIVAIVALLAVTAPILTLNLGFNGVRSFHDDADAKKALIVLEENFTLGLVQPAVILVDAGEKGNVFDAEIRASVDELITLVEQETASPDNPDAFFGQIAQESEFNDAGDTEAAFIPINADSGDDRAIDAVNHLRNDLIPEAFEGSSARVLVTGATAANIDFRDNIIFRSPFVFAWVLVLAFIILLLIFRSVVIAASAILLNMLSVGFAYGLLVLVFQEGWLLEGVLDFEATGIIESWIPLFLFSIIFGLSIDYEMFVMSRIKEQYELGATTDEAISRGMKATAGVITNAAAIMVAVAAIFAFMRNIGLQQFGFGLAAAVLIDATVIRAFVLPTTMKLLGDWNWYLPSWLEWLPEIKMAE